MSYTLPRFAIFPLTFGLGLTLTYLSPFDLRRVEGPSMRPTLNPEPTQQDLILVKKIRQPVSDLDLSELKGRIVVFQSPKRPQGFLSVKRVVACQGDQIVRKALRKDEDGQKVVRKELVPIPQDHVWVESDGGPPGTYRDSYLFGPLKKDYLVGVALGVIWPPNRFGSNLERKQI